MDTTDHNFSGLEGNKSVNGETNPNKETTPSNQQDKSTSTIENPENSEMKKKRGRKKGKKIIPLEVDKTRYSLRSSADGGRILRSMSNGESESENSDQNPNNESVAGTSSQIEPVSGTKKRARKPRSSGDKLYTIRNRVRSLNTKINYEQNLIDAYSTDGWKGQSLEKLRPEKEIERAKAAIIKTKLKIRESFKELGILAAEGKLDNFDDKGEIDCEDIFCAKCGLKNATLNNDIILCDGICDRGFHQNCLNPPLLTKDIPPGDEGWLCPACDCKLDCIVLLNESKGSNLCLQDTWEKVFPEAAAAANGTSQIDPLDLPSDDSEDDDFNPDAPEGGNGEENGGDDNGDENGGDDNGEEYGEDSGQEESTSDEDFYTDSDSDNEKLPKKAKNQKKQPDIEELPSEDSEDDDFDPERRNSDEESSEKMLNSEESDFTSDSDEFCDELVKKSGSDEDVSTQLLDQDMVDPDADAPIVARRQKEPTDYKKLYRETFGKSESESSEDEDWSEKSRKKGKGRDLSESSSSKQSGPSKSKRNLGLNKTKTLQEYFATNQYPTRESKEILAEELELTYEQVNKWFEAARRQARSTSAEMSNGSKRRGRPSTKNANKALASISDVNATFAAPYTPNSAVNAHQSPTKSLRTTTPNSAINAHKSPPRIVGTMNHNSPINAQKSPPRSVGITTPSAAVNVQKMPPASVGMNNSTETSKNLMDNERKKAIMRELRKQKMGR